MASHPQYSNYQRINGCPEEVIREEKDLAGEITQTKAIGE